MRWAPEPAFPTTTRAGRSSRRRGASSWHLSTCGTKEIDLSLSSLHLPHPLASDQGRHGGCRLGWALGPSSLASNAPSLSFILAPPKVEAPSEIRVCRAIALWTGLAPRSFLPRVICFSPSIYLSLSVFLSHRPPSLLTDSGRALKSGSAWRSNCGQGWALCPYISLPSHVSLGPPPY